MTDQAVYLVPAARRRNAASLPFPGVPAGPFAYGDTGAIAQGTAFLRSVHGAGDIYRVNASDGHEARRRAEALMKREFVARQRVVNTM